MHYFFTRFTRYANRAISSTRDYIVLFFSGRDTGDAPARTYNIIQPEENPVEISVIAKTGMDIAKAKEIEDLPADAIDTLPIATEVEDIPYAELLNEEEISTADIAEIDNNNPRLITQFNATTREPLSTDSQDTPPNIYNTIICKYN